MDLDVLAKQQPTGLYRSGVAARLAGIPVETLRVWERRHGVVRPGLSEGRQRLYSAADVRRLTIVKRLTDMGHSIGVIAPMSTEALAGMHALGNPSEASVLERNGGLKLASRTVLVGPLLSSAKMAGILSGSTLTVVGSCANPIDAAVAFLEVDADNLIIELPILIDDSIALIDSIKAASSTTRAVVFYRFAPSAIIRRLRAAGVAVSRSTSDVAELASMCLSLLGQPPATAGMPVTLTSPPAAPMFDDHELMDLLGADSSVFCECPRQLAELVMNLGAFERYSNDCANRSPGDALLHRDLQHTAGHARVMLEAALVRVAIAEGLPLPTRTN